MKKLEKGIVEAQEIGNVIPKRSAGNHTDGNE
jgi:hypothetical protein